jgi:uncharacterized protein (TIGR03118 family)
MPSRSITTLVVLLLFSALAVHADSWYFVQHNLVSDISGLAATTDLDLKNPWGIAASATSPFWIGDNGTGKSTLYNGAGAKQSIVVTVPGPGGTQGDPTGVVFNGTGTIFHGDNFIFATESGQIMGWRGALGTTAETLEDNSASGASYTGVALLNGKLYAANFAQNTIDVFDAANHQVLTVGFKDPTLPSGYSVFNIQNLGGSLYVTYAPTKNGLGTGFVDVFDGNGVFLRRVASGSALDNPWGVALAPAAFANLGGDLLVGNFGNGEINAYDNTTGAFIETLSDINGNALVNDSLWGLMFGNNNATFNSNALYFAAGLQDENHGLFGSITAVQVPEPASLALLGGGIAAFTLRRKRK